MKPGVVLPFRRSEFLIDERADRVGKPLRVGGDAAFAQCVNEAAAHFLVSHG